MLSNIDLSLNNRKIKNRDSHEVTPPVHFSLKEIKQHFDESMDILKAQFKVAESLASEANYEGCKTIWRSQVVFAEALLDYYIHEMSKFCLFRMFTGRWDKSEKYSMLLVPMGKVENAIEAKSSNGWFFEYLNERFSREVFLSKECIKDQLNLIGIGFGPVMKKAFPKSSEQISIRTGGQVVADLFYRRNLIVHQNDRSHASAIQNDIDELFVSNSFLNIEKIVKAIHDLAEEKEFKESQKDD